MLINKAAGSFITSQLQKTDTGLKKILEKLSTGKQINQASDDAAMLSIAQELQKQVRGFKTVDSNLEDALSALRISDGGMDQISGLMQRQRELAVQASNGTLNQNNRESLNTEYQALQAEIDRISSSTQYNRQNLLDGSSELSNGTGTVTADPNPSNANNLQFAAVEISTQSLGTRQTSLLTSDGARSALSAIDGGFSRLNQARTTGGALYNRVSAAQSNAINQNIQTTNALSQAEDLDYAKAVSEKVRTSILSQSGHMVLKNFNEIARNNVLGLLN